MGKRLIAAMILLSFVLSLPISYCQESTEQELTEKEKQIYQECVEQTDKIMEIVPESEQNEEINNAIRELADKYGLTEEEMKDIINRGFYSEMQEMHDDWWGDSPD